VEYIFTPLVSTMKANKSLAGGITVDTGGAAFIQLVMAAAQQEGGHELVANVLRSHVNGRKNCSDMIYGAYTPNRQRKA
jgi:hypothetical protein